MPRSDQTKNSINFTDNTNFLVKQKNRIPVNETSEFWICSKNRCACVIFILHDGYSLCYQLEKFYFQKYLPLYGNVPVECSL